MKPAILFTGPGGLRAVQSLQKLVDYCDRQGHPVCLVEIDDHLVPEYLREFPAAGDRNLLESPGGLSCLLLRPKDYLRTLWRKVVTSQIEGLGQQVQCLFLSMHSVFYSNQSREFFSPVQAGHLKQELARKGFRIQRVVTLLDDVFDVFRHLVRPGQLFEFGKRVSSQGKAVEAILSLHLALHWRSIETFHSAEIARLLKKPHVLLAVKHPLRVSFDIAFAKKPMAYVAHPIKDVRSSEDFQDEIEDLTRSLRAGGFVVPVSPTSIDELLLEQDTVDEREIFRPRLGPRWRFGRPDDLLFVPPQNPDLNPVDPDGVFSKESDPLLAGLLHSLADAMTVQVNARDRALVEQASAVVVWRPFFGGQMSGGAREEILHRNWLLEHHVIGEGDKRCFVYSPPSDLGQWRVRQLVEGLRRAVVGQDRTPLPDPTVTDLLSRLISDEGLVAAFADGTVRHERVRAAVAAIIPDLGLVAEEEGSTLSGTRTVLERREENERWQALVEEILRRSPLDGFLQKGDLHVDKKMTVDEFVARVRDEWTRSQDHEKEASLAPKPNT